MSPDTPAQPVCAISRHRAHGARSYERGLPLPKAPFHCRGGRRGVASVPRRSRTAHGAALRLSSIIRLEGTMRVIFPLPSLLVAGAALGGLVAPFGVGGVPTDSIGIAAAAAPQVGADVGICHGP